MVHVLSTNSKKNLHIIPGHAGHHTEMTDEWERERKRESGSNQDAGHEAMARQALQKVCVANA